MSRKACASTLAVALVMALDLPGALAMNRPKLVSVRVPPHPVVVGNVTVSFKPREPLPSGGYYYAVVVLTKHDAKHLGTKRCARSSNMGWTEYAYPTPGSRVHLALSPKPTRSTPPTRLPWCAGAVYKGAVYAVPHSPPCRKFEPCYGHTTAPECYEGETLCGKGGKQLHGVVPQKRERPGTLPPPLDSSTRIIASFQVHFRAK